MAAGSASYSQLRRRYTRVLPDIYVSEGTDLTPAVRARAAWLWSRRRGVIVGFSASALYGTNGWTRPGQWTSFTIIGTGMLRYRGRRGIGRARVPLDLVDAGAQSPKETWLRLVLVQAGLPRPQTQIPVLDDFDDAIAYLDMGWEDVKVAVEYDVDHHRSDRTQYSWDVKRLEMLQRCGWIVIRVVAADRPGDIVRRPS